MGPPPTKFYELRDNLPRSTSRSLGLRVPGGLRVAHQRAKFNADLGWCLSPLMPGGPYPATLLALAGERDPGALG